MPRSMWRHGEGMAAKPPGVSFHGPQFVNQRLICPSCQLAVDPERWQFNAGLIRDPATLIPLGQQALDLE